MVEDVAAAVALKEDVEFDALPKTVFKDKVSKAVPVCMVIGVVVNFALLLVSHVGVTAVVFGSLCPQSLCPPIDVEGLVDACQNDQDLAIFVEGSEAFEEHQVYQTRIGLACLGQGEECQVEAMQAEFGVSLECASCFGPSATCAIPCASSGCFRFPGEEDCSNCLENTLNCNQQLRNCTGINFPARVATSTPTFSPLPAGETLAPTNAPSATPTSAPTVAQPTFSPTVAQPTFSPTVAQPTFSPSSSPTKSPTQGALVLEIQGDCFVKDSFERFPLSELTFFDSVFRALTGGSYFLAILLIFASGIWPYVKNIMILFAVFKRMSDRSRGWIIHILATLGKWNLVDAFTVILIINGAFIQKTLPNNEDTGLVIFTESRIGVFASTTAALWNLFQVEVLKYFERKRIQEANAVKKKKKVKKKVLKKLRIYKACTGIFAVLAWLCLGLGVFFVCVTYNIGGRLQNTIGPNETDYTGIDLGLELIGDCAIYDEHGSLIGTFYLAFVFLAVVVAVPLVGLPLLYLTSVLFTPKRQNSALVSFTFGLLNFCAIDVFVLCLFTVALQLEGLIDAAVGDNVNEQCGVSEEQAAAGEKCVSLFGTLQLGSFILLAGTFCFWISQFLAARMRKITKVATYPN